MVSLHEGEYTVTKSSDDERYALAAMDIRMTGTPMGASHGKVTSCHVGGQYARVCLLI